MRADITAKMGFATDEEAFEALIELLHHKDMYRREHAIDGLEELGDLRALEHLVPMFAEEAWDIQVSTSNAIYKIVTENKDKASDEQTIQLLLNLLDHEKSKARSGAICTLRELGYTGAIDQFISALNDRDNWVRSVAATALGVLEVKSAAEPLKQMLNDENVEIRYSAADALAYIGDKTGFETLVQLLDEAEGLTHIRDGIEITLIDLGDKLDIQFLIASLRNENDYVRQSLARVLGKLKQKEAVEPLIKLLKDSSIFVRYAAVNALAEIGDERALADLEWVKETEEEENRWGKRTKEAAADAIVMIKERQ